MSKAFSFCTLLSNTSYQQMVAKIVVEKNDSNNLKGVPRQNLRIHIYVGYK